MLYYHIKIQNFSTSVIYIANIALSVERAFKIKVSEQIKCQFLSKFQININLNIAWIEDHSIFTDRFDVGCNLMGL